MKYIKYTYVDSVTGVSVEKRPAVNGPIPPAVQGLEFVWARESQYPTDKPEFFGTCPDSSGINFEGVLGSFVKEDWDNMWADELLARNPVPDSVARAQGKAVLIGAGLWKDVLAFVAAIEDPTEQALAEVALHDTQRWNRNSPFLTSMKVALGLSDEQLNDLFIAAAKIEL